jgi:plastocyanin
VDQSSGTSTTTITVGQAVLWAWVSGVHDVDSGTCSGSCTQGPVNGENFESPDLTGAGQTFQYTFANVGTVTYFCSFHGSAMQGQIIVNP